ncbi:hypothetical protein HanRHA438_Chr13g0614141 [Helianthus annuus]|nr:hypothetical protein HanRHA438_Chr13g0614141 [Helianthus annuus]
MPLLTKHLISLVQVVTSRWTYSRKVGLCPLTSLSWVAWVACGAGFASLATKLPLTCVCTTSTSAGSSTLQNSNISSNVFLIIITF